MSISAYDPTVSFHTIDVSSTITVTKTWEAWANDYHYTRTASEGYTDKTFDCADLIPANSTIHWSWLYVGSVSGNYGDAWVNSVKVADKATEAYELDLDNALSATVRFWYQAYCVSGIGGEPKVSATRKKTFGNVYMEVFYTPPGKCSVPTSVTVSPTSTGPGGAATLSWGGSTDGHNNAVAGYYVSIYNYQTGTEYELGRTNAVARSYPVTAPTGNGQKYKYRVYALPTLAGYASDWSAWSQDLACAVSVPSVSAVTLGGSNATQYKAASEGIRLAWSATQGTNNNITWYAIQYSDNDGGWALYDNTTNGYYDVLTHPTAGNKRRFRVIAIAPHGNSTEAYSPYLYAYSAVTAPTTVTASPTTRYVNEPVTISWSGAGVGVGVGILKYELYCNDSLVGSTTGSSLSVNVPGTAGNAVYKVKSKGTVSGYDSGLSTASATVAVNVVPEPIAIPSIVTPNKWSMAPLDTVTSTLTIYNAVHWHRITYSFHGASTYVDLSVGTTMHDFTFPEGWLASRATSATGSLVITVSTYSGATLIGTREITITINIPSSYGPTIGTLTATLVKNGGPESIDRYIKGISKATLEAGAFVYQQGAYAVGFSISGGGYYSSNTSVTFGVFPTAGTITFTAAALDSRGFTTSKQVSIIVQEYSSPTLSGVAMFRCDEFGTADSGGEYVSLKATSVFASIDGQNTATLQGRVYMRGGTPGAWSDMTSGTALLLGGGLLSVAKTYISEIKITDKIGNYAITAIIPTDSGVGLHIIDGSLGAAIGKYAEREKFFELPDDWTTNIVSTRISNQNLLHNWDFRNPVNQRGASGTISSGYFYDRWQINGGNAAIYIPYLSLSAGGSIIQKIEGAHLAGKTVTGSVMINNVVFSSTPATIGPSWITVSITGFGNVWLSHDSGKSSVIFENTGGAHADIQAVKLELGTVSTLAYDPQMDYGAELLKCSRFFRRLKPQNVYDSIAIGRGESDRTSLVYFTFPQNFRILPTITRYGQFLLGGTNPADNDIVSGLTLHSYLGNRIGLIATISYACITYGQPTYFINGPSVGSFIDFSADL